MQQARIAKAHYERHRPENTLLYQLVAEHYPEFKRLREAQGLGLPRYIQQEFESFWCLLATNGE